MKMFDIVRTVVPLVTGSLRSRKEVGSLNDDLIPAPSPEKSDHK